MYERSLAVRKEMLGSRENCALRSIKCSVFKIQVIQRDYKAGSSAVFE